VAVSENALPHRLDAVLPATTTGIVVSYDVLDEHQRSAGLEDAAVFGERATRV
jgi:hypothetical protein